MSLVFFIVFIAIGYYIFMQRSELKREATELAEKYLAVNDEEDISEEEAEEYLSDYDRDHHDIIKKISKLHKGESVYDSNLDSYIIDIRKNGNSDDFYLNNKQYLLSLLRDTKIIGDSMVFYIAVDRLLTYENISVLKGVSVKRQYDVIADELKGNEKTVILWNGYHIKYFDTISEYIESYKNLIDKIHEKSPDCKVYICSLIPASNAAIKRDIDSGFLYEIYKGPEFDAALRENFKDEYININDFFTSEDLYFNDGVHPSSTAYRMIIPYLAFYINGNHKAVVEEESSNDNTPNKYYDTGLLDERMIKYNVDVDNTNAILFNEYEKYLREVKRKHGTQYYDDHKDYVKSLYKDTCFVGDSNVLKLLRLRYVPGQNVVSFGAGKLEEMIEKIDDETRIDPKKFKNIVFWNGYNIKYIQDSSHIISEYNRLIDKIHAKNPDCKVYICSLLPASKNKIEEDLIAGSPHNIYKGTEYDNALKEYFKDQYINTKVLINGSIDYTNDGFHMQNDFYKRLVPYVGFYVNIMDLKSGIKTYEKKITEKKNLGKITFANLPDNANDEEYNEKLHEFRDEINENHHCIKFYDKNKKFWEKLLENTKFIGDSNAYQLIRFDVLTPDYVEEMRGKSLKEQLSIISNFIDGTEKNIVLWNGYNIKYYGSPDEYVEAYQRLIEKIRSMNKTCNIYICSLLPAKKSRVEEDLKSDFVHNIHRGPEFDSALEKYFGEMYIDTKPFLFTEDFYQSDGVHLNSTFMKMLVLYSAFYINNDIVR